MRKSLTLASLALLVACATAFSVSDLLALERIGSLTTHEDLVIYTSTFWNETSNVKTTSLYSVPADGSSLPEPIFNKVGEAVSNPVFVDHEHVLVTKNNDKKVSNIFSINLKTKKVTELSNFPVDVDNLQLSPDGTTISFAAYVYPGKSLEETAEIDAKKASSRAKARVFDRLFIRHWSTWETGKFRHVHVAAFNGVHAAVGKPRDVMPKVDGHTPSEPFGGSEEFAFSPDSKSIAYSVKTGRTQAWLVDNNVWLVPVDGSQEAKCLSCENKGRDMIPAYSPCGKRLAWLSTTSEKDEAARNRIVIMDLATGKKVVLTEAWDRTVQALMWSPVDPANIYATTYENGYTMLFAVNVETGAPRVVVNKHSVEGMAFALLKSKAPRLIFQMSSYQYPSDLYTIDMAGNGLTRLTDVNNLLMENQDLPEPLSWTFTGAANHSVQAWVFKPLNAEAGKKYPVALYCHGGPESPWSDQWSYRWNPQILADQGFAVLAINFHGSPGWGSEFTKSIQKDWGGKPFDDQMIGLQTALNEFDFMDKTRVVGLGASYGGYTMAWMQAHAPKGLMRALVLHDGIYDLKAMYGSTEEIWFLDQEMGGSPDTASPEYEKWSPSNYADQWNTPMLIIHGEQDFRIPYTEGISAFTNLQRRGIDSKLVLFPDENHWVMEPNNSILWHEEVIGWIKKYTQ